MIRVAQGGLQLFPKIGLQAFNVACIESSSIACWNRTPRAGRPSARRYCVVRQEEIGVRPEAPPESDVGAERTDRLWAREVRTAVESEYVSPLVRSIQLYALLAATAGCATCAAPAPPRDWPVTGGDPGNTRYSPLTQIDRRNVARLRLAWTYHSGDVPPDSQSQIQATPIVVDGVLYTTTPPLAVIALRADKGTLLWRLDPFAPRRRESHVNRGVVYWAEGGQRPVFFTAGPRLWALDAGTGGAAAGVRGSGPGGVRGAVGG